LKVAIFTYESGGISGARKPIEGGLTLEYFKFIKSFSGYNPYNL